MLLGRIPGERTVYRDADGNPCAAAGAFEAVVEREPEWTERDRQKMAALVLYESQLCPLCQFHESLHDPARNFYQLEWRTCVIEKGRAETEARRRKGDEKVRARRNDESASDPEHGRYLAVRRLTPDEVQAKRDERR